MQTLFRTIEDRYLNNKEKLIALAEFLRQNQGIKIIFPDYYYRCVLKFFGRKNFSSRANKAGFIKVETLRLGNTRCSIKPGLAEDEFDHPTNTGEKYRLNTSLSTGVSISYEKIRIWEEISNGIIEPDLHFKRF